jgi:hypothetical protein
MLPNRPANGSARTCGARLGGGVPVPAPNPVANLRCSLVMNGRCWRRRAPLSSSAAGPAHGTESRRRPTHVP